MAKAQDLRRDVVGGEGCGDNFVGDIGWTTILLPTFTSDGHQMVSETGFAQLVYARLP